MRMKLDRTSQQHTGRCWREVKYHCSVLFTSRSPEPYLSRLEISYVAASFQGSKSRTEGRYAAMPGSVTACPKCHRHSQQHC